MEQEITTGHCYEMTVAVMQMLSLEAIGGR